MIFFWYIPIFILVGKFGWLDIKKLEKLSQVGFLYTDVIFLENVKRNHFYKQESNSAQWVATFSIKVLNESLSHNSSAQRSKNWPLLTEDVPRSWRAGPVAAAVGFSPSMHVCAQTVSLGELTPTLTDHKDLAREVVVQLVWSCKKELSAFRKKRRKG